jgi:hypothetical protein
VTNSSPDRSLGRVAWVCVGVLAIGGYCFVLAPAEGRVQYRQARAHDLYELAYRNERMLARAAGLSAARDRVALDVAELSNARGDARTTLGVLQLLQKACTRGHVTINGVAPDGPVASGAAGFGSITIGMRGSYRSVLGVIADLSAHRTLIEVSSATLAPASGSDLREIDATVRANVYSKLEALVKESPDAKSSEK